MKPGKGGVTCWRWELSRGDHGSTVASAPGMISHEKLTAFLETLPKGELLMRGDSVAFPPGGCAYPHRHQGPGIRCMIEGGIRIDTHGRSTSYGPGGAWYETGPDPVFAQAAADQAEPLHPRDDPAARMDRQKLDPVSQRRGQGEAEDAELQDLRRCADFLRAAQIAAGHGRRDFDRRRQAAARSRGLCRRRLHRQVLRQAHRRRAADLPDPQRHRHPDRQRSARRRPFDLCRRRGQRPGAVPDDRVVRPAAGGSPAPRRPRNSSRACWSGPRCGRSLRR